ncbi:MAG: hypothetical protein ACJAWP_000510 [Porticoccus sp.]|jgi:hypothetical protein|uniref:DUF4145 domain-containing protein n=1 Tax=Porticoccus sp. TaxID=2024853 RepID=UPI0039E2B200
MTNKPLPYRSPEFSVKTFHCPNCSAYSKQRWAFPSMNFEGVGVNADHNMGLTRCDNCEKYAIWVDQNLVFPIKLPGITPNPDLSDDIKADFDEARRILNDSPRGAAALLRLAVQKICIELGKKGKNINGDIAELVKEGLPPKIQQALDVVRVVGNNAVHPGSLDMKDNIETANKLFALVNLIAEVMISQPKHVEAMYDSLVSDRAKEAIQKRDGT